MKRFQFLLYGIFISLLFVSCSDKSESPEVFIASPLNLTTYSVGSKVVINGNATDDFGVITLQFRSLDLNFNESLSGFPNPLNVPFTINITIDPSTSAGEYSISVLATDEDVNVGQADITIVIQ